MHLLQSTPVLAMSMTDDEIVDTLLKALDVILNDATFSTGANAANVARVAADRLRRWCSPTAAVNRQLAGQFMRTMLQDLQRALGPALHREVMWQRFYRIRSSADFISRWTLFLQQAQVDSTPALYQQLTDIIFKDLLKSKYVIPRTKDVPTSLSELDGNALRYAAGYIVRELHGRYKGNADMATCLKDLLVVEGDDFEEGSAEKWVNLLDRGGLWHVRETTFQFFTALEREFRCYLPELVHASPPPASLSRSAASNPASTPPSCPQPVLTPSLSKNISKNIRI